MFLLFGIFLCDFSKIEKNQVRKTLEHPVRFFSKTNIKLETPPTAYSPNMKRKFSKFEICIEVSKKYLTRP